MEFIQNKGVEKVTLEVRGFERPFRNLLAFSSCGLEGHDLGHCPQGEGGHPREAEGLGLQQTKAHGQLTVLAKASSIETIY